jgi:peptide/nickel transport system substrate-binding protein
MGEIITESLQNAGLNVKLSTIGYDALVTKLLDTFEWDAVIIGIEGSIEPNESSKIWESKGPLHLWSPYSEKPQTEWEKRIDELFALGRTTWDLNAAKVLYQEYQAIIAHELPVINIVVPAELYGYRNGFENVIPSAVSYNAIGLMPYIYKRQSGYSIRKR